MHRTLALLELICCQDARGGVGRAATGEVWALAHGAQVQIAAVLGWREIRRTKLDLEKGRLPIVPCALIMVGADFFGVVAFESDQDKGSDNLLQPVIELPGGRAWLP